ncbi:Spo0E family sporulation regulatory protein-aspartic acid phosphatase [Halanaerobacter jeridensis]|uniref:Spo0E like sporulation regulatory protein n=1 Tax=Halanaerobacter jeridensis TaxID=706427 RepID=A0A939BPD1_9FIRM|nr:Spo0E family sporulation regulatory protein-aspartic acid phosphatase [Halanaerobacter jeridensis]MBM7556882.1 hypothetical protein [Halanaerobacter jeridensis]
MQGVVEKIEEEKEKLNQIYKNNNHQLAESHIVAQSRRVDELIVDELKKQLKRRN